MPNQLRRPSEQSILKLAIYEMPLSDAVDNMNKAKALLDATTVKSNTDGTVVEVNKDVSKSTTGTNQTLVHIVSNGNLQVKGELSEYNLANISEGQEVVLTSKVIRINLDRKNFLCSQLSD